MYITHTLSDTFKTSFYYIAHIGVILYHTPT